MKTINDLKRILKKSTPEGINGARKSLYQRLCVDKYCYYNGMILSYDCINYKTPEILAMSIGIPISNLGIMRENVKGIETYVEDYFFRQIAKIIKLFEKDSVANDSQKSYVQSKLFIQDYDNRILKRSCAHLYEDYVYIKCHCKMPLNGLNVIAGKKALKMITELLKELDNWINNFDLNHYRSGEKAYLNQLKIRSVLKERNAICFIKNGSILPRIDDNKLKENAVPFLAPKELEETLYLDDGEKIVGMLLKQGITAITGGAYSGKTTILEAIQSGIHNHVIGDGREYVITDESAVKICAEDGRLVNNLDISPFFQEEINGCSLQKFSTQHASGSTSQAVNIIEAIYSECNVLLIDEDRSATNFMHRDIVMRDIIEKEPIIPLTDRISEISQKKNVSLILVIGGTSEYFGYADKVILMDSFKAKDITNKIKKFHFVDTSKRELANWTHARKIVTKIDNGALCDCVCTKDRQVVFLNEYVSELTNVGYSFSLAQLNLLAKIARLVLEKDEKSELKTDIDSILMDLSKKEEKKNEMGGCLNEGYLEEIRRIDVLICLFRMSGIEIC